MFKNSQFVLLCSFFLERTSFSFSAVTQLGDRKGFGPLNKLGVDLLVVTIWLELCMSYSSSFVTTTSIILSSNKIQNGDIYRLTQVHLENGC